MSSRDAEHDAALVDVLARIQAQRLRWTTPREPGEERDVPGAGVFPRSHTLRFLSRHRNGLALGAGVLLLRKGWIGQIGLLVLQRFALRQAGGR